MRPPSLGALAPLVLLVSVPPAAAQSASGEGLVTIGTGLSPATTGTYDVPPGTDAWPVFHAALNDPTVLAGEVVVLAGTYLFDQPVAVARDGVRLSGSRAAVLRASASNGAAAGIFDVTGDDFALVGLTIEVPSGGTYAHGQDAVRIGPGTRGTLVRECLFSVDHGPSGAIDLDRAHAFLGLRGTVAEPFVSARIVGNDFVFSPFPASDQGAIDAPLAFRAVDAERGNALTFRGNSVRRDGNGLVPGAQAWMSWCVRLIDVRSATLHANVFSGLGVVVGPPDGHGLVQTLVEVDTPGLAPGDGATLLTGNYFEDVAGVSCVDLDGPLGFTISGNGFGRSIGVLRLRGSGAGDGRGVVSGNEFHNVGAAGAGSAVTFPTVSIEGRNRVTVASNQFSICVVGPQIRVQGDGIGLRGNHFTAQRPADCVGGEPCDDVTIGPAIEVLAGSSDLFVMHNFSVGATSLSVGGGPVRSYLWESVCTGCPQPFDDGTPLNNW